MRSGSQSLLIYDAPAEQRRHKTTAHNFAICMAFRALATGLFLSFLWLLYRRTVVLGLWRWHIENIHGELVFINDTVACEDLHHDPETGLLFTACQVSATKCYNADR